MPSQRSERTQAWQGWYKLARWKRLRAEQLKANPYCQCPHHQGSGAIATVVDHIRQHNGDAVLFWDRRNLQSVAKSCHDMGKQRKEKSGFWPGCDINGHPIDRDSHWNNGS